MANSINDEIDLKILRILQSKPEIPIQEIGEKVGLSHTPCWRRIKKMQDAGLLKGRVFLVDQELAGYDVSIFVFVRLDTHSAEVLEAFEAATLDIPEKSVTLAVGGTTVYLPLAGMVDIEAERTRIQGEMATTEEQIQRSEDLLANHGFVSKAPEEVVARERDKLQQLVDRRDQLVEHMAQL